MGAHNHPQIVTTLMRGKRKRHYVYELYYPEGFVDAEGTDLSNVVFYVGKGTVYRNTIQRIDSHEYQVAFARCELEGRKENAILRIWSKGMSVQKRVTFETDSEQDALDYEAKSIKQHLGAYLTNKNCPAVVPVEQPHPVFVLTPDILDRWLYS